MECWSRCGPAVLPNSLVHLMDTGDCKRKTRRSRSRRRRRKTRTSLTLTISLNGESCSDNDYLEAHERLTRGTSKEIILPSYLPRSINELVIELSEITIFTVP